MKNKVTSSTQVSNKKSPWSWDQYLEEEGALAAPPTLFTQAQAFPSDKNGFKVGMRLEGIDPLHPSMFCVLSVAEVIGYRLRLHIDGYSECYDFWVNKDSPDIRPVGWCHSNAHTLHPPKGYTVFDWDNYLETCCAQTAPHSLFTPAATGPASRVAVGMKLEAVDRKNPCLVCVASVADVIQQRFLVHFDNWDDSYDYWCDATSPHIHPVGWCQDHGRPLTAPQGHPDPEHFQWEKYLEDSGCSAAPSDAFAMRAPHGFRAGMRVEAVDRRNSMLLRVATVCDAEDYRVKVHYDGWPERFDVWLDSDSADLHPVGWAAHTGHPLEPPPASEPRPTVSQGVCPTPGCRGIGHIKGARYTGHHSAFGCPYSETNLRKEAGLPDRLGGDKLIAMVPVHFVQKTRTLSPAPHTQDTPPNNCLPDTRSVLGGSEGAVVTAPRPRGRPPGSTNLKREQREASLLLPDLPKRIRLPYPIQYHINTRAQPTSYLDVKEEEEELPLSLIPERGDSSLQAALHQSVFLSAMSARPGRDLPLCWEQHCKLLPGLEGLSASNVALWSTEQVCEFVHSLPGCEEQAKQFLDEQIDGRAFLLLTQRDIVRIMSIKLGPALKIYNSILMFKHAEESQSQPSQSDA